MPAAILHASGSYADSLVTDLYTLTILCALRPLFLLRSKVRQELWVMMQIILASVLAVGALLSSIRSRLRMARTYTSPGRTPLTPGTWRPWLSCPARSWP